MIWKRAYHPEGKPSSCEPKVWSSRSCSTSFGSSHGLNAMIVRRHKELGVDMREGEKEGSLNML